MVDEDLFHDIELAISARDLKDLERFGISDPLCRIVEFNKKTNDWKEICSTEPMKNNLNPDWKAVPFRYYFEKNQRIKFFIMDSDKNKPTKLMGQAEITIPKLMRAPNLTIEMPLEGSGKNSKLIVHGVMKEQKAPKMLDFLKTWRLDLSVAIDFTASNLEEGLHEMGPNNMYEKSIAMVGSVLEPYDTDSHWPVFGFGGKPPGETSVNHCFPLTGNLQAPCVQGVEQTLGLYRSVMPNIKLSGPTKFAPILTTFRNWCAKCSNVYNVLLILTDGMINDMVETKNVLCELAKLPCSVIIVGIGSDPDVFEDMIELDGDTHPVKDSNGVPICRDIVQFVEFQKCI